MAWPTSLRARLTLWYTLMLGVPLIAFALVSYFVVAATLERRTDIFIGDALAAFTRELSAERHLAGTLRETMQRTVREVRFRELHIAILDSAGRVAAMSELVDDDDASHQRRLPSTDAEAELLTRLRASGLHAAHAMTIPSLGSTYRVVSRVLDESGEQFTLVGVYELRDIADVLERLRGMFQIGVPLLLVAAAFGGSALARRSLAPVAAMTARAADISESNMSERLPASGGDELVRLSGVINGLLDRLQASFDRQRRFITDASHELRTPTAVVRTEADVTLSRAHRDEDEYRTSVTVIRDASERLTRIVDDLFLLSRADSGHLAPRRDALYFEEVVDNATRAVRSVALQRAVVVELRALVEAPITGDADLLGRLVLNLLDNAIKHSPHGGVVAVEMVLANGAVSVSVIDEGEGIPVADQARVFERFVRLDAARSRSENTVTSGAGLGLAIARRITELHGGRLELVESRPGRTEFRATLPLRS